MSVRIRVERVCLGAIAAPGIACFVALGGVFTLALLDGQSGSTLVGVVPLVFTAISVAYTIMLLPSIVHALIMEIGYSRGLFRRRSVAIASSSGICAATFILPVVAGILSTPQAWGGALAIAGVGIITGALVACLTLIVFSTTKNE